MGSNNKQNRQGVSLYRLMVYIYAETNITPLFGELFSRNRYMLEVSYVLRQEVKKQFKQKNIKMEELTGKATITVEDLWEKLLEITEEKSDKYKTVPKTKDVEGDAVIDMLNDHKEHNIYEHGTNNLITKKDVDKKAKYNVYDRWCVLMSITRFFTENDKEYIFNTYDENVDDDGNKVKDKSTEEDIGSEALLLHKDGKFWLKVEKVASMVVKDKDEEIIEDIDAVGEPYFIEVHPKEVMFIHGAFITNQDTVLDEKCYAAFEIEKV